MGGWVCLFNTQVAKGIKPLQSDLQIPVSLQPYIVDFRTFKLLTLLNQIKYLMFTTSGSKDIGI